MNKKLSALLALIFCLAPLPVMADNPHQAQGVTVNGNNFFQGSVTATNLNPVFLGECSSCGGSSPAFNFNNAGSAPSAFTFMIDTNQALLAAPVQNKPGLISLDQITGFSVSCIPYNPVTAVAAPGNYPYNIETNGIAGGTVTVTEYNLLGSAINVGTLVLPTSPHGGPYINTATSVLPVSYTPTPGSVFSAYVTTINPVPNQFYQGCNVTAVLQ